ncbi:MAG TPA: NAD(P)H-dependent oxidoreductase [Chitinophagaceae bacterium]
MNIEIISGSPRKNSVSWRVALHLRQALSEKTDHRIGLIDVREWDLGLLQEVWTTVDKTPGQFRPLAERMFAADAFIIVTPEYNGSYSPALQNLMDHFPKQARKPFGIVTSSVGAMGGMRASQQCLLFVAALFGIASPYMLIVPHADKKFDAEGQLVDDSFTNNVHTFITEFLRLAETLKPEALAA